MPRKTAARSRTALRRAATPEPSRTRSVAAAELLAAIRADPTDDGARQVYADVLVERGDPRGELITMQLAREGKPPTEEQAKRELGLLGKHVRSWLGELAGVAGTLSRSMLSVGPERTGKLRFERGFLAAITIHGSRAKVEAIANHPDLATVEELDLMDHGNLVLERAELPALDELQVYARYLSALRKNPARAQIQKLTLWDRDRGARFAADVESCEALPALRTLRVLPRADILDDATSHVVRAGVALPQIDTLVVELSIGGVELTRKGTGWSSRLLPDTPRSVATAVRALI